VDGQRSQSDRDRLGCGIGRSRYQEHLVLTGGDAGQVELGSRERGRGTGSWAFHPGPSGRKMRFTAGSTVPGPAPLTARTTRTGAISSEGQVCDQRTFSYHIDRSVRINNCGNVDA
jgi:hypothetical protein